MNRALVRGLVAVLALGALTAGCERKAPHAEVTEPEVAREATPTARATIQRARGAMVRSWRGGAVAALSRVRRDAVKANVQRESKPPAGDAVRHATIVFSGNNRGEREDCGCKRNPLGGLARRGTLLDLAAAGGDASRERWGRFGAEPAEGLFYVDAGDSLFKNARVYTSAEGVIEAEMKKARAVVAGMNALAPDAAVVGSYELSAGWTRFEQLRAKATFPFVSANLRVDGVAPLPSHVVVDRGGLKVAFIGMTAPRGATSDFHEKVGVTIADSVKSYRDATAELDGVDVVVMLSNAGVAGTEALVEELEGAGLRVDAAIVSGSGAQTTRPTWMSGVPAVEPNARGKYVGRADLWIVGEGPLVFANDTPDVAATVQRYKRAVEGYSSNRAKMLTTQAEIFEAKVAEEKEARDAATLGRELEFALKRMELVGGELSTSAAEMSPGALSVSSAGDDWFEVKIAPVKIEIEEKRSVKRAVDTASR